MRARIPVYTLSKKQKAIIDREAEKYFEEKKTENAKRIDAMFMLMLHREFGFGKERLKRFHKVFIATYEQLSVDFQDDGAEIAKIKLKEATGVDIDELFG